MMEQERIQPFLEKHLDETASLITNSFLSMNRLWQGDRKHAHQIFSIVRSKCLPCVGRTHSFVLTLQGRIIGAAIQMDYVDYINAPPVKHNNELMARLGRYAALLDKHIPVREGENIRRGEICYGLYGVIDPQFANKGYSLRFWSTQFSLGKAFGWKCYYSRFSNQISFKMLKYMGAEEVAVVEVAQQQGARIYLGRLELGHIMTYSQIAELVQSMRSLRKSTKKEDKSELTLKAKL